jgi:hypothetical protein
VIVPGLIGGLKVVAVGCGIVLILGLVILFVISLTHPFEELGMSESGTNREATFAETVTVTPERPLAMRIVTASVDPASAALVSIPVVINLSTTVPPDEMWVSAVEIVNGRAVELEQTGAGHFDAEFPAECHSAPCSRTYALMICWLKPVASEESAVYIRAFLQAVRRTGTPPANVAVDLLGDSDATALGFAEANGCTLGE